MIGRIAYVDGKRRSLLFGAAMFNDTYQTCFHADRRPARTTIGVTALAVGALVEIDCIAKRHV